MKKRFPNTLLQSVLLFALGCVFGIPILFISDYFPQSPITTEVVMFSFTATICTSAILIALIKNKRNGLPIAFNGRLYINQGFVVFGGTIISIQLVAVPIINLISKFFSLHPTDVVHSGIVNSIGAILLAPILEELLFRGTILTGMLENYTTRKAILLTTAFFALIHGNILHIIPAFFWGLLLGYTFYKTRSIVLGILLHMTVNFTGSLDNWMHPAHQHYTFISAYGQYSWMVYGIATIGLITGCYLLFKKQMFAKYLAEYQQLL
ncbi:MAG: CPBP family intramembrane metalloprotease [Bacteroidota bacterium]|nr:CPBP family intramembrane metalloprotease [Bacteroidota bacterium]